MAAVGCFYGNPQFHDATLLLSADSWLLEQTRRSLHESLNSSQLSPKRRRTHYTQPAAAAARTAFTNVGYSSHAQAPRPSAAQAPAATVVTIPVHRLILSTESDYFRTAISTLVGNAHESHGAARMLHPIIVVHEEDVEAAQGVLQFLYTKAVDSRFYTASQLMHLLLVADRWVVAGCVSACCKALTAIPTQLFSLKDLIEIYSPGQGPLPPSLLTTPEFKPVLTKALSKLLQLFGNIPSVVSSLDLTAQLLQLPHAAIHALLCSNLLATDSEDSVLMILSWWLEGKLGKNLGCNVQLLSELMESIRYSRLSPTYLAQAVPLLRRLSPTTTQLTELNEVHSYTDYQLVKYCKYVTSACPSSWFKPQRPFPVGWRTNTVSVTLSISTAQLSQHLALARQLEDGGPRPNTFSAAVNFRGLNIQLDFSSRRRPTGDASICRADILVGTRLPSCFSMTELKRGIPGSSSISIYSKVVGSPLYTFADSTGFLGLRVGWGNFAQTVSNMPGNPLLLSWWDPFIIDGHIKLTAQITDERI